MRVTLKERRPTINYTNPIRHSRRETGLVHGGRKEFRCSAIQRFDMKGILRRYKEAQGVKRRMMSSPNVCKKDEAQLRGR